MRTVTPPPEDDDDCEEAPPDPEQQRAARERIERLEAEREAGRQKLMAEKAAEIERLGLAGRQSTLGMHRPSRTMFEISRDGGATWQPTGDARTTCVRTGIAEANAHAYARSGKPWKGMLIRKVTNNDVSRQARRPLDGAGVW